MADCARSRAVHVPQGVCTGSAVGTYSFGEEHRVSGHVTHFAPAAAAAAAAAGDVVVAAGDVVVVGHSSALWGLWLHPSRGHES